MSDNLPYIILGIVVVGGIILYLIVRELNRPQIMTIVRDDNGRIIEIAYLPAPIKK